MGKYLISCAVLFYPLTSWAVTEIELTELVTAAASKNNQNAGEVVANIGDINGDGYEDVAVGAPDGGEGSAGLVYLIYGKADRFDDLVLEDQSTLTGEDSGDHFGSTIAGVGDINADGFDDFMVTALYHDATVTNPGTVYLFYGQNSELASATASNRPRWYGEAKNDHAGVSVVGAGDLNNDDYDDIAIGTTWHNNRAGGVYIIYGQATAFIDEHDLLDHPFLSGEDDYDYAGAALAAGDVTGDGLTDLVVSATKYDDEERDVGRVYTVPGTTTPYTNRSLGTFSSMTGTTKLEKIGTSLVIIAGDLYIGAAYNDAAGDNAGVVYVNSTATATYGEKAGDLFGKSLAVFNGAALVGAPSELDPEAGSVWLVDDTTTALLGAVAGDEAGYSVATADVNGDGQAELVIGAPGVGASAGAVYIGYWPIYTCANSVALGGILASYPSTDYKLRTYAANSHFKIAVERRGQQAFLINCNANRVEQTLTFNTRTQRKILARVFQSRGAKVFIAVTRTPSKRKIKIFLYQQTESALVETDYLKRKWRPRGFRIKLNHHNKVVLQKGEERKHRLRYRVRLDLTLNPLD